jgi:hypothetical protein
VARLPCTSSKAVQVRIVDTSYIDSPLNVLSSRRRSYSGRILRKVRISSTLFYPRRHTHEMFRFSDHAAALNVSATDLYTALLADAEIQSPNWNLQGRQANLWKQLGYIPQDMFDSGGANTKQVSRTLEVSFYVTDILFFLRLRHASIACLQRFRDFSSRQNPWKDGG